MSSPYDKYLSLRSLNLDRPRFKAVLSFEKYLKLQTVRLYSKELKVLAPS
jgi:hypothetical protein